MRGTKLAVGIFSYLDDLVRSIHKVREMGLDYKIYAPMSVKELEELALPSRSPIRFLTLLGGMTGLTCGFALAIWCSLDWPLRVSAKAIVSIPAFIVVGYELTILFAALITFVGILHFCRLPFFWRRPGYDPRFTDDKFGLVVGVEEDNYEQVSEMLKELGAEEVSIREGL